MRIAIIGAGMAGSACGAALAAAGHVAVLIDKGRGPGGRASTRRIEETPLGPVLFDHGAQYATARDPAFVAAMSRWENFGAAAPWRGRFSREHDDAVVPATDLDTRWVGVPGMKSLVAAAHRGLDVRFGERVVEIAGAPGAWRLVAAEGDIPGLFDAIVVATPAEQVAPLVEPIAPEFAEAARAVRSEPCWAVMAVYARPAPAPFDGLRCETPPFSWIGRDSSKPGRAGPEAWIGHADPSWSRDHLEEPAEVVAAALAPALTARIGAEAPPVFVTAHRWRFAQVPPPNPRDAGNAPVMWDDALRLGVCGDWRRGPRLEAAFLSGLEVALAIDGRV